MGELQENSNNFLEPDKEQTMAIQENINDFEIFQNIKYSDILHDIYNNHKNKENLIQGLIGDLSNLLKKPEDAMMVVPMISEFLKVSVENDEQLYKITQAAIKSLELKYKIQKDIIDKEKFQGSQNVMLSDSDKKELKNIAMSINEEKETINDKLENLTTRIVKTIRDNDNNDNNDNNE